MLATWCCRCPTFSLGRARANTEKSGADTTEGVGLTVGKEAIEPRQRASLCFTVPHCTHSPSGDFALDWSKTVHPSDVTGYLRHRQNAGLSSCWVVPDTKARGRPDGKVLGHLSLFETSRRSGIGPCVIKFESQSLHSGIVRVTS